MEPEAPFRGQVFTVTAITLAVKQTLEGVFRDMELLDGQYRDVVFMARLAEK